MVPPPNPSAAAGAGAGASGAYANYGYAPQIQQTLQAPQPQRPPPPAAAPVAAPTTAHDAQQAQWHAQWQQYYAQQAAMQAQAAAAAAVAGMGAGAPMQHQLLPQQHVYGMQPPQPVHLGYSGQQPGGFQQQARPPYTRGPGPQVPGQGPRPNGGPQNKRQRTGPGPGSSQGVGPGNQHRSGPPGNQFIGPVQPGGPRPPQQPQHAFLPPKPPAPLGGNLPMRNGLPQGPSSPGPAGMQGNNRNRGAPAGPSRPQQHHRKTAPAMAPNGAHLNNRAAARGVPGAPAGPSQRPQRVPQLPQAQLRQGAESKKKNQQQPSQRQQQQQGVKGLRSAPAPMGSPAPSWQSKEAANEARRSTTDFKISEISIDQIGWKWKLGGKETSTSTKAEQPVKEEQPADPDDAADSMAEEERGDAEATPDPSTAPPKAIGTGSELAKECKARFVFAMPRDFLPPPNAPTGPKAAAAPTSATATDDGSSVAGTDAGDEWTSWSRRTPAFSTNRIMLMYGGGRYRLVVDTEVVKHVIIHRKEYRMEIAVNVQIGAGSVMSLKQSGPADGSKKGPAGPQEWVICRGVWVEKRAEGNLKGSYVTVSRNTLQAAWAESGEQAETEAASPVKVDEPEEGTTAEGSEAVAGEATPAETDFNLPPLFRLLPEEAGDEPSVGSELLIQVAFNPDWPLPSDQWLRTGDLSPLLSRYEGVMERSRSLRSKEAHPWAGRLEVADPDPPPTLKEVLIEWGNKIGGGRGSWVTDRFASYEDLVQLYLRSVCADAPAANMDRRSRSKPRGAVAADTLLQSSIDKWGFSDWLDRVTGSMLACFDLFLGERPSDPDELKRLTKGLESILNGLPLHLLHRGVEQMWKEYERKHRKELQAQAVASAPPDAPTGPKAAMGKSKRKAAEMEQDEDAQESEPRTEAVSEQQTQDALDEEHQRMLKNEDEMEAEDQIEAENEDEPADLENESSEQLEAGEDEGAMEGDASQEHDEIDELDQETDVVEVHHEAENGHDMESEPAPAMEAELNQSQEAQEEGA